MTLELPNVPNAIIHAIPAPSTKITAQVVLLLGIGLNQDPIVPARTDIMKWGTLSVQLVTIPVLLVSELPPIAPRALLLGTDINQEAHVPVKILSMTTDQHLSVLLVTIVANHVSTVPSA